MVFSHVLKLLQWFEIAHSNLTYKFSLISISILLKFLTMKDTGWKGSKYGVFSGPYFLVFGLTTGKYEPEKTPHLDTFRAVWFSWDFPQNKYINWLFVYIHWEVIFWVGICLCGYRRVKGGGSQWPTVPLCGAIARGVFGTGSGLWFLCCGRCLASIFC